MRCLFESTERKEQSSTINKKQTKTTLSHSTGVTLAVIQLPFLLPTSHLALRNSKARPAASTRTHTMGLPSTSDAPWTDVTLWSTIVTSPRDAVITEPSLRIDYPYTLTDRGAGLRGTPYNLTIGWQTTPDVGVMWGGVRSVGGGVLPAEYGGRVTHLSDGGASPGEPASMVVSAPRCAVADRDRKMVV